MKILAFGTALFAFVLLTGCADDGRDGAPNSGDQFGRAANF